MMKDRRRNKLVKFLFLLQPLLWTTTTGFQQQQQSSRILLPRSSRTNIKFVEKESFSVTIRNKKRKTSSLELFQSFLSSDNADKDNDTGEKKYFLRKAVMADLSYAAEVLTEGFYGDANIASKWWEKLQTQMNLESNLPSTIIRPKSINKNYNNAITGHDIWVACEGNNGKVIGVCEVDNRPPRIDSLKKKNPEKYAKDKTQPKEVRPYMCNLVVRKDWRKKGVAQDMIRQCEQSVTEWYNDAPTLPPTTFDDNDVNSNDNDKNIPQLYLKVKDSNAPAVALYMKLGYRVVSSEMMKDSKTKKEELLLIMKREWDKEEKENENADVGIKSNESDKNIEELVTEVSSSSSSAATTTAAKNKSTDEIMQWNGPTI